MFNQHVRLVKIADTNKYAIAADCGPRLFLNCSDEAFGRPSSAL
jgi:hypothetical protein